MVEKIDENKREDKETIKKYIREDREGMIQMVKKQNCQMEWKRKQKTNWKYYLKSRR